MTEIDIEVMKINWVLEPFPHAVIDDFLPHEIFKRVSQIKPSFLKNLKRQNSTSLEYLKNEFGVDDKNKDFKIPIDIMGFGPGKNLFREVISPSKIITLGSFDNFAGYYPYHSSYRNGLLGSHVDHSSLDKYAHFANSIYYVHESWQKEWKGGDYSV